MKTNMYLCLCLSLVNLAFMARLFVSRRPAPLAKNSLKGNDFPVNLVETTDRVSLTVEESAHYPLVDETSWAYWTTIAPIGFGLNTIEDRIFSVAMFHEMHCLSLFTLALARNMLGMREHIEHCLGYIRAMSLCASDLTLEPGDFTKRNFSADPFGATHECVDWTAAYDVVIPVKLDS